MPGLAPPLDDEGDLLLAYLVQQRQGIRNAAYGLTDAQARSTPVPSSLSIGGLVKHVTAVESWWIDIVLQRADGSPEDGSSSYQDNFTLGEGETLAEALARYAEVAARTEAVVATWDLGRPVPVPPGVPWFPADVEAWSLRWVLLHLVEETARHAGHADIIREAVDGATMYPLMAAVEGWPATEWLTPWAPRPG